MVRSKTQMMHALGNGWVGPANRFLFWQRLTCESDTPPPPPPLVEEPSSLSFSTRACPILRWSAWPGLSFHLLT